MLIRGITYHYVITKTGVKKSNELVSVCIVSPLCQLAPLPRDRRLSVQPISIQKQNEEKMATYL